MNGQKLVIAALFVVVGGAGVLQWQLNRELRSEIAVLRGEMQSLSAQRDQARQAETKAAAVVENAEKTNEQAELMQLRAEVNALKVQAKDVARLKISKDGGGAGEPAPALNLVPSSAWKNAGKGTPATALESVFWAASGGDVDAISGLISINTRARVRAQELFAGLPEATQAQYGSVEKFIALYVAQGASPVAAYQVLGTKPGDDPDETEVSILVQNAAGGMKKDQLTLRQLPDGYHLEVGTGTVEKIARHLQGPPPVPGK